MKGVEHTNTILSLAGAIFVIPFIFFASITGALADRFSKRSIILTTRTLEIGVMLCGLAAFYFRSAVMGYAVLFMTATLSSTFSPAKYGIIPELVKKGEISKCNGILTATTYLAIILGTFLASFLTDVSQKDFVFTAFFPFAFSIVGALATFGIQKTSPKAPEKKVSARFITVIYQTLKKAKRIRYLLTCIIFSAYFLFLGAYTQLNIIPFAMQSLHFTDVQGGYLFLMTAIGIGLGSFFAGRFSGKEVELGFVPVATLVIAIIATLLYLFSPHFIVVSTLLILLGVAGGFYVVPLEAFIQTASLSEDRGQNIAAANFLSFTGVIIASFLIAFFGNFLGLTASEGFLIIGILTFIMSLFLFYNMGGQLLRLVVAKTAARYWNLKVKGEKHLKLPTPALLVGQRISWLDTIVVMATLPRLLRYIVPTKGKMSKMKILTYKMLRLIPVDIHRLNGADKLPFKEIDHELSLGHSVCVMLPMAIPTKNIAEFEERLQKLAKGTIPILPIHISRPIPDKPSYIAQIRSLFQGPIRVNYGSPL